MQHFSAHKNRRLLPLYPQFGSKHTPLYKSKTRNSLAVQYTQIIARFRLITNFLKTGVTGVSRTEPGVTARGTKGFQRATP